MSDPASTAAARRGSPIEVALEPGVTGVWDQGRIEQVVHNLLDNALKYGAGTPIELEVSTVAGRARLVVRDHGIGIEPEALPRIFDKFERAPSSRDRGGLGLGLYVVDQIVALHGGTVRASSTPGAGTEIVVELPLP